MPKHADIHVTFRVVEGNEEAAMERFQELVDDEDVFVSGSGDLIGVDRSPAFEHIEE